MEEMRRGVDSFVLCSYPILVQCLNIFVAEFCLHYNTPRSILTTPENTMTYHNALYLSPKNFGVTTKSIMVCQYGFFLEWSIPIYQNSNMTPRLQGQNCTFFTTPLSRNSQKRLEHKLNEIQKYDQKASESCQNFNILNVCYLATLNLGNT